MRTCLTKTVAVGLSLATLVSGVLAWGVAQALPDTFVVHTDRVPVTLDPARAYEVGASSILENVYETLLTFDRDTVNALAPGLATSFETSADGLEYIFALREGVAFHSGNELTCGDVEYTLERGLVTAHPESAFANLLVPRLLDTGFDGADPEAYANDVGFAAIDAAVECLSDSALRIRLAHADPSLPSVLAFPAFGIVDRAWAIARGQWDGSEGSWRTWIGRDLTVESMHAAMSGTGAYRLVSWSDEVLVAERFDAYWGGTPPLERVVVRFVEDANLRVLALRQGDADHVVLSSRAHLTQLAGAPGVTIHTSPAWVPAAVDVILFHYDIAATDDTLVGSGRLDGAGIPPNFFTDPDVRKGLAHLLDHQRYIDDVLQGEGTALTMALPPSFAGYDPDAPLRTLDVAAAEAHLRTAFDGRLWDTGFAFTALGPAGRGLEALEMIAHHLELLNSSFRMDVLELARPAFFGRLAARQAPMSIVSWRSDYSDPATFIRTFYASNGPAASFTGIDFPELDEIIRAADRAADPTKRAAGYRQVGGLQHELVPLLPLPLGSPFLATRSDLQGVYYSPLRGGAFLWRDVSK